MTCDADLWESLYAVADAAGADWPERIRRAHDEHQWEENVSESARVLKGVATYFAAHGGDRVSSTVLAAHLSADDLLPSMTPKSLATRMSGYRVRPRKSHGVMTYWLSDLTPVFAEWLRDTP
ncbi:MAG: DUF3631 domain-containing protein [Nocardioides sp.]